MENPEPAVLSDPNPAGAPPPPRLDMGSGDPSLRRFAENLRVFGNEALEVSIALHLVAGKPLLCGGPPGSAKSLLLCACYRAIGLATVAPNMAFAGMIEDLCGFPDSRALAERRFARLAAAHTPWRKEAAVLEEITRTSPALQAKVNDRIHDRRMLSTPIETLRYVSATCNLEGAGVEPLSEALAGGSASRSGPCSSTRWRARTVRGSSSRRRRRTPASHRASWSSRRIAAAPARSSRS